MRTLRGWGKRLRAWLADGNRDRDLGDELESVVQMHLDEYPRDGMTREEARRQALIEVGGVEQVRQAVRERRGWPSLRRTGEGREVRPYAPCVRTPGFSVVAVAGDGARHRGERRVVHRGALRAVLRPLPFPHPDRLVALYSQDDRSKPDPENLTCLRPIFTTGKKSSHGYQQMAIWRLDRL